MSQTSAPSRIGGYRFIFPPPAYCAYTGGTIPVASTDTRPATATNAYPMAHAIPVNAPAHTPVHVEDVNPVCAVVASPYPSSNYRLPPSAMPVHVADPVAKKSRVQRS